MRDTHEFEPASRTTTSDRATRPVETKHFSRTSEFWVFAAVAFGVLIAGSVVGANGDNADVFRADKSWLYVTILAAAYLLSRGIAKIGTGAPAVQGLAVGHDHRGDRAPLADRVKAAAQVLTDGPDARHRGADEERTVVDTPQRYGARRRTAPPARAPHRALSAATDTLHEAPRGVAQSGSAPGWGPGGRRFKSCLPDERKGLQMRAFLLPATRSLVGAHIPFIYCLSPRMLRRSSVSNRGLGRGERRRGCASQVILRAEVRAPWYLRLPGECENADGSRADGSLQSRRLRDGLQDRRGGRLRSSRCRNFSCSRVARSAGGSDYLQPHYHYAHDQPAFAGPVSGA